MSIDHSLRPDRRDTARVQLPFEVELNHPTLGRVRSIARDVSEGGVFVVMRAPPLKQGARLRLTVLNSALIEGAPTPTIEMEVARVVDTGMGLKFTNQAARHLWNSVQRLRDQLDLGRDYFQVFQAAIVTSPTGKLLVLQQNGRWLFPGRYLTVGEDWHSAMRDFLQTELGVDAQFAETVGVDSGPDVAAVENATMSLFHRFVVDSSHITLASESRYRHPKWIGRMLEVDELSFAHPLLQSMARQVVRKLNGETASRG